jgi:hypothetical protein
MHYGEPHDQGQQRHDHSTAAARETIDSSRVALQALAAEPSDSTEEAEAFQRQMEIARERMKKYRVAYRNLAK